MKFALFILMAAISANSATWYIAKTGNDTTGDGSVGNPYLTVQKGVTAAQAGDNVLVAAGTYAENVTSARHATSGSRIVIDGQGVATIHSMLFSHRYTTLQNMTIAGKASGWWTFMARGAHFNTISNNYYDGEYNLSADRILRWDNPEPGHLPWGTNVASDCLVISNTFTRGSGTTIIEMFGDRNVVYGNRLINGDACDWFHVWGRTNTIAGNTCSNSFVSGLDSNHPDFFQSFGLTGAGARNIIIESNLVINSYGDSQLCMFEGQDNPDQRDFTFRNNLFINISMKGTMACPDVKWYNNTFYRCGTNSAGSAITLIFTTATNATYTNFAYSSGHGGQVFNNAFIECGDGNTDRGWYSFATYLTNVAADYNFVSQNGYAAVDQNPLPQSVGDVGGWDVWTWYEPNGINGGDPLFVDESGLNFNLSAGSPLIGVATNLNSLFTTDIEGVTRGSAWDMGSFQFVGSASSSSIRFGRGVSFQGGVGVK